MRLFVHFQREMYVFCAVFITFPHKWHTDYKKVKKMAISAFWGWGSIITWQKQKREIGAFWRVWWPLAKNAKKPSPDSPERVFSVVTQFIDAFVGLFRGFFDRRQPCDKFDIGLSLFFLL